MYPDKLPRKSFWLSDNKEKKKSSLFRFFGIIEAEFLIDNKVENR
jgi:hypothetical protein